MSAEAENAPNHIAPERWKWFGSAGHFIGASNCAFHLCTKVGKVLVSTVGEYRPKSSTTGAIEEIGLQRTFETMVFRAGKPCSCGCGLPEIDGNEIDFEGYNDPASAAKGHMQLCRKWSRRSVSVGEGDLS